MSCYSWPVSCCNSQTGRVLVAPRPFPPPVILLIQPLHSRLANPSRMSRGCFCSLSHPKSDRIYPQNSNNLSKSLRRNTADSGFRRVFSGLLHEITPHVKAHPNPSFLPPHSIGPARHMTRLWPSQRSNRNGRTPAAREGRGNLSDPLPSVNKHVA